MKQFFKFMFASFVGTLLTLLLLLFILVGTISALISMADSEQVKLKPQTVLVAKFDKPILDRSPKNPFENFDFANFKPVQMLGLDDILKNIEKAEADPNIEGIYLDLSEISAGMATIQEIRQKLIQFKASGKFIFAYSETYSQGSYYLASIADQIYLNPKGGVMFKGLMSQIAFLKGTLEKLEVEAQIIRGPDNKFKSAVEPLMYDKMSEANREQMETLLNSAWDEMLAGIGQSRGIEVLELNRIADELLLENAEKALEHRIVDKLVYKDEMLTILREKLGTAEDDKIPSVSLAKYTNAKVGEGKTLSRNKLAVIYAIGGISGGEGSESAIGSEGISRAIRKAREDDKVKAIVMRVNSPGGSALASETIRREVELAKAAKPFIVSMGDVAASGGYWISTNADYIFAEPNTITGSIGVFGVIPYVGKMFENKLGVTFDRAMTNDNSDFIDVMKPLSDFQRQKIQDGVVEIYNDFTKLVADTRNLRQTYVDSVGQGRVWTGKDALDLGLVDGLGGIEDAIQMAAEKASLGDDYRLYGLPEQKDAFQQIVEEMSGQTRARTMLKQELGTYYSYLEYIEKMANMKGVQARLPFYFTIE